MCKAEILVIDDETIMRKMLEITLLSNGYGYREAATAKQGLIVAANHPPNLILLDLGLPDKSGHQVLRELRKWYAAPIIILSVQKSELDIVSALDNGANDYLAKPFRTGELLARIRSALRSAMADEREVAQYGSLWIDFVARTVKKNQELVKLTATEYNLIAILMRNEGKVLTHHHLLHEVWGPSFTEQSQYLRVFIAQIRKKLEDDPNRPKHFITESGIGYRFIGGV